MALAGHDARLVAAVLDQAGKNEKQRARLEAEMEEFAKDLGVQYVKKNRSAHSKPKNTKNPTFSRSMHDTWERIAAPLVVPMHLSHSYVQAILREDEEKDPGLFEG